MIGKHIAPVVADFWQELAIRLQAHYSAEDSNEVIRQEVQISQRSAQIETWLVGM